MFLFLKELLQAGKAQMFFTGVAVNLLNLRPEVCLLLHIEDGNWWKHHSQSPDELERFHFNWEFMSISDHVDSPGKAVARMS